MKLSRTVEGKNVACQTLQRMSVYNRHGELTHAATGVRNVGHLHPATSIRKIKLHFLQRVFLLIIGWYSN